MFTLTNLRFANNGFSEGYQQLNTNGFPEIASTHCFATLDTMANSQPDQIEITFGCFCKKHVFTHSIPKSSLPLKAFVCHCDSCRRVTGALYSIDVRLPGFNPSDVDLSTLSTYQFSNRMLVHFCGTCSSPLFFHSREKEALGVFTGVLPNLPNLVSYEKHGFLGDTLDGGASVWLQNPNIMTDNAPVQRFEKSDERATELPKDWPPAGSRTAADVKAVPDAVPLRCHCGGVDLLLHRWEAGTADQKAPFYVDPKTQRYLATFDACDSCRLSFGVDITNWTFAPFSRISFADGSAFPSSAPALVEALGATKKDSHLSTLARYSSSKGVSRYFCSRCSACFFYHAEDRPDMFDIAIGVLHAPDGARAESLLWWRHGNVGHKQDVGTSGGWREGLAKAVEKESEEWRVKSGLEKVQPKV